MAGEKAQAGGAVIRLLVNISVIKGLLGRSNRTRWNAVVLDCLGLVIGLSCIGSLLFLSGNPQIQQQAPPGTVPALMLIFAVQSVFWIVDIVMLCTPSARAYCNNALDVLRIQSFRLLS